MHRNYISKSLFGWIDWIHIVVLDRKVHLYICWDLLTLNNQIENQTGYSVKVLHQYSKHYI